MKLQHRLEDLALEAAFGGARRLSRTRALKLGATLGSLVRRLGLRTKVARENLTRAFPEWSAGQREDVLRRHYEELGRVALEYGSLGRLARAPRGEVVAEVRNWEYLERLKGRGAILLSAHFGNFELVGAHLGQSHPTDFVVKALSNPLVEERIRRQRQQAGLGTIDSSDVRNVYRALRAGRWVGMLADQDARRQGIFVPFFGVPASTPAGPARIALATGAPIVMGFDFRQPDGRNVIELQTLEMPEGDRPDAVEELTRRHVQVLESVVRRRPESWFWVHRRWKTRPA